MNEEFELKLKQQGWKLLYLMSVFATLDSILAATTSTEAKQENRKKLATKKIKNREIKEKRIPVESWMEVVRLPGTSVNSHSMITNPQTNLKLRNGEIMGRFLRQAKQLYHSKMQSCIDELELGTSSLHGWAGELSEHLFSEPKVK